MDLVLPSHQVWVEISEQVWVVVLGSAIRLSFLYRHVDCLGNIRRLNQVRVNPQTSLFFLA